MATVYQSRAAARRQARREAQEKKFLIAALALAWIAVIVLGVALAPVIFGA